MELVDSYHGLLVMDKPGGRTSRAVVDQAQKWFPRGTRIGHTGTLDPLATGVLVLCVGAATRLTEYVQNMTKTYQAGLVLGARSTTDDADGEVTPLPIAHWPDRPQIELCLQNFLGEIDQVPPAFSAVRVNGRRAYDLARQGKEVIPRSHKIRIYEIVIICYEPPRLELEVVCGKGTYIRSLARDLGERLGCGAYVQTLRRLRVGRFSEAAALHLDLDAATARAHLLPLTEAVAELPALTLADADARRFRQGQLVSHASDEPKADTDLAVIDALGNLVGIGRWVEGWVKPIKVMPWEEC